MRQWISCVLVALAAASGAMADDSSSVEVTGKLLSVNGFDRVPRGLFGVHAMYSISPEIIEAWGIECVRGIHHRIPGGPTEFADSEKLRGLSMYIDCQGDRYQPALPLVRRDFAAFLAQAGTTFGQRAAKLDHPVFVEFWNEPYLNWASKSRINYQAKFFETRGAVEGGPVTIKGWDKPLEHMRWRKAVRAVNPRGEATMTNIPAGKQLGDTFEVKDRKGRAVRYAVREVLEAYDPTQVSYWSGRQNRDFYLWMLVPFAKAVKAADPDVNVIAGWDFHIYSSGYKGWAELYQPTIDAAAQWIDGISEHHYGSDPLATAASYEVVTAYGWTKHGRWLRGYNTECGGRADPAVPGNEHLRGKDDPLARAAGAYTYGLRDIMYLLAHMPDKAASRATHMPDNPGWGKGGDEFYFRLLKPLRGRLVQVRADDRDLWPVAALNGDRLVIALHNDARQAKAVSLSIAAPGGAAFGDGARRSWVEIDGQKRSLKIVSASVEASGRQAALRHVIGPRQTVVFELPLRGEPRGVKEVVRRQVFAKGVLHEVKAGRPLRLSIVIEKELLAKASGAALRLVMQGTPRDVAGRVNGHAVRVPARQYVVEMPIDVKWLRSGENVVEIESPSRGMMVNVASLVVEGAGEE